MMAEAERLKEEAAKVMEWWPVQSKKKPEPKRRKIHRVPGAPSSAKPRKYAPKPKPTVPSWPRVTKKK